MKTTCFTNHISTWLTVLALAAWGATVASAQLSEVIYCARMHSTSTSIWDTPFWWISAGGSAYSTTTAQSTAPGTSAGRVGSYEHTANNLSPGEGFGVVCTACGAAPGLVYQVEVTQPLVPSPGAPTNILFGVCSTNCDIGGLSGGGGDATNTTAFQAAYSVNKWAFVCWLTNTTGVGSPEIEFHYVSGDADDNRRHYADCVRFSLPVASANPTPVRITGLSAATLQYAGGSGARFVLLKSTSLSATLSSWQRADTNSASPGAFTIPAGGTSAPVFYAITSE